MEDCIFCKIAHGELPHFKIWEDEKHVAFLSIFPNTEGMTVVITKEHHDSYAFNNSDEILTNLVLAAKKVGKILDDKLDDVGRTSLVFEGFGINHLHAKLFPMHGTKNEDWRKRIGGPKKFFEHYEGYISTHDYDRADDMWLASIVKKITE